MDLLPTIFIVESNRRLAKRLARLVEKSGARPRVFTTAVEFSKVYRSMQPSCLVLSTRVPGLRTLEFHRDMAKSVHRIPVVFIAKNADVLTSVTAMKEGAVDFLKEPIRDAQFLDAIKKALQQVSTLREEIETITQIHRQMTSLTIREREVLLLVVAGLMNKQIAAMLGTGEKTIKVHRSRVMKKMNVESVAQLARMAERVRLPNPKLPNSAASSGFSNETLRHAALSLDFPEFDPALFFRFSSSVSQSA
jgi:FixJ family two-component response regulator